MRNTIASAFVALISMVPAVAAADTDTQLISLYQQLVAVLTEQLHALAAIQVASVNGDSTGPQLVIDSPRGTAPYYALLELPYLDGTEAVDFGDGHSTGSNGCTRNALGYCDLRHQLVHMYQLPGTYTVTVYRHEPGKQEGTIVTHASVTVDAPVN